MEYLFVQLIGAFRYSLLLLNWYRSLVCNLVLEQEKACKGGLYCSYIAFKLHKDIWPSHLYTSRIMLLKAKDYVRQSFTGHIPKAVPRDLAA